MLQLVRRTRSPLGLSFLNETWNRAQVEAAETARHSEKFHEQKLKSVWPVLPVRWIKHFLSFGIDPWYHAVASITAYDIVWGTGLVLPVILSSNHPSTLVRLRSTVEELTVERLRLGASISEAMQRWLNQRSPSGVERAIWKDPMGFFLRTRAAACTSISGEWPHLCLSWVLRHHQ